MWQAFSKLMSRTDLIKSIFKNTLAKNEYGMNTSPSININFVLEICAPLFASDLLSSSILQTTQNGLQHVTKYFALTVALFNNTIYLFRFSFAICILIILVKNAFTYKKNGELSKMFLDLFWIFLILTALVLHVIDPMNDYILGHWK
jgi:hypothetical protein